MKLKLIAATAFGLEAVVRREIEKLGYEILATENGRVIFAGNERAVVRANLWLRTADRVQILLDSFEAKDSEVLFQRVRGMAWERILPIDAKFVVTCSTVKSRLRSEPNNQKTVKKAIAMRLGECYAQSRLPETGAAYTIKISLLKDRATLTLDTTGEGLHKRGYRSHPVPAPVKETLAAAMVQLSFWKEDRLLVDPCCGSGTIPIEAAMIGRNIAPGLSRHFAAEAWDIIPQKLWKEERAAAYRSIRPAQPLQIEASDIDGRAVAAARANAEEAGVDDCITFSQRDAAAMTASCRHGIVVTNPPYGERIGDAAQIEDLYRGLRAFFHSHPDWSLFMITPDRTCEEKVMGRKAERRRKLYNGRLEVCFYQFHGRK